MLVIYNTFLEFLRVRSVKTAPSHHKNKLDVLRTDAYTARVSFCQKEYARFSSKISVGAL